MDTRESLFSDMLSSIPSEEKAEFVSRNNGITNNEIANGFEFTPTQSIQAFDLYKSNLVATLCKQWAIDGDILESDDIDGFNFYIHEHHIYISDIRFCIKNNVTFNQYVNWADYVLERRANKYQFKNLENYLRFSPDLGRS